MSLWGMLKRPSGFLPVLMSLAALAVVGVHIARWGPAREADEGAAAHIFQLLMALQVPIVAFFAFRWVPRAARPALQCLAVQVIAAVAALAPVALLQL
jgi:hypothetical protein